LSLLLVKVCPQSGTLQGVQCTPTPLIFEVLYTSLAQISIFVSNENFILNDCWLKRTRNITGVFTVKATRLCLIDELVWSFILTGLDIHNR
jgi:hypothetical protein